MSEAHRIAGQKGGKATLAKYGREHFQTLGSKSKGGGRPTWQQELKRDQEEREKRRKRVRGKT